VDKNIAVKMDKKRARGGVGKYPCEDQDPGTSKKRRLIKKYNDRPGEANIAPSKMLKVIMDRTMKFAKLSSSLFSNDCYLFFRLPQEVMMMPFQANSWMNRGIMNG
jgi:hypothetical protein